MADAGSPTKAQNLYASDHHRILAQILNPFIKLFIKPIRCQVWKSLLTNMDFNMEIS